MPIIKNCVVCFKKIKLKPSELIKNPGRGTYCSRECMAKDYEIRFNGINNRSYKHGMSKISSFYDESRKIQRREWKKNNPGKVKASAAKYRARKKGAGGNYTGKDIENKLIEQNNSCYWCLEELFWRYEVDHIIPISKNGSNCINNIVVACSLCNNQKNDMLVDEWYKLECCRAKRKNYATGRLSEKWNRERSSESIDGLECSNTTKLSGT